jgi:hypothetical protein
MTYAMTILSDNTTHRWEPCRARTPLGAKREATRTLGPSAYDGDRLAIAIDHGDGNYQTIAIKDKDGWHDLC